MHEIPPTEAIRRTVGMHFNLLSRQSRRDYAGFAVGKRRKLEIVPFIAREMATRILQQVVLEDDGKAVEPTTVAKRIEAVLLAFPDAEAFHIASDNTYEGRSRPQRVDAADNAGPAALPYRG
jgi:hypothetical protein